MEIEKWVLKGILKALYENLKLLYDIGDDVDYMMRLSDDISSKLDDMLDDISGVLDDIKELQSYISSAKR